MKSMLHVKIEIKKCDSMKCLQTYFDNVFNSVIQVNSLNL
jgi:hypothetical protein